MRPHHSTVVQSMSLPDDPLPVPTENVQPEVNQTCKEEMSSKTLGEGGREGGWVGWWVVSEAFIQGKIQL